MHWKLRIEPMKNDIREVNNNILPLFDLFVPSLFIDSIIAAVPTAVTMNMLVPFDDI